MTDARPDPTGVDPDYQLRHHLAVIQAQAEVLLADDTLTDAHREALERIHHASVHLDALTEPTSPAVTGPTDRIERVDLVTTSDYLAAVIEAQPEAATIELTRRPPTAAPDPDADAILVDAVLPTGTGVDYLGDHVAPDDDRTTALLSVYTDETTPVALALSGILDPSADAATLTEAFAPAIDDTDAPTMAGFLADAPPGPLADGLASHVDTTLGDTDDALAAARADTDADIVCIDLAVYRQLSPRAIGRLRTIGPGRGRPLVLVADTGADPAGRSWVPTLGGRRHLHLPPDLIGILACLTPR